MAQFNSRGTASGARAACTAPASETCSSYSMPPWRVLSPTDTQYQRLIAALRRLRDGPASALPCLSRSALPLVRGLSARCDGTARCGVQDGRWSALQSSCFTQLLDQRVVGAGWRASGRSLSPARGGRLVDVGSGRVSRTAVPRLLRPACRASTLLITCQGADCRALVVDDQPGVRLLTFGIAVLQAAALFLGAVALTCPAKPCAAVDDVLGAWGREFRAADRMSDVGCLGGRPIAAQGARGED